MPKDQHNRPGQKRPATGKQVNNSGCVRVIVVPILIMIALVVVLSAW